MKIIDKLKSANVDAADASRVHFSIDDRNQMNRVKAKWDDEAAVAQAQLVFVVVVAEHAVDAVSNFGNRVTLKQKFIHGWNERKYCYLFMYFFYISQLFCLPSRID